MAVDMQERNAPTATMADPQDFIASTYFHQGTELLRRGAFAEAETYLREVVRIWPNHPGALNNLGTSVWQQGRAREAEAIYRRALDEAPDDFGILNNCGNALWEQTRPEEAIPFYHRALEIRPEAAETQMNLGVALSDLGQFDEAIAWIKSSIHLEPGLADAYDNLGMTLARLGRWDEALALYDRAIEIRPRFPEAHRNKSFVLLTLGDYRRGWAEHEWRLRCKNHRLLPTTSPMWKGEDLDGRSILLHAEQGLGDVIMFIRFAEDVKRRGAHVVAAVPDSLIRLISRATGVDEVHDWFAPLPTCDYHAPLMSLPSILGTTLESLPGRYPYLSPDDRSVELWRPVFEDAIAAAYPGESGSQPFRVGIVWQGNPSHRNDLRRSFPLELFRTIAEVPGVQLISLQKGKGVEQLEGQADRFPVAVFPGCGPGEQDRRDFVDTAAAMTLCDLVIAPDSSTAHLAGSIGVPVWIPLTIVSDCRWLTKREDSPWYPSVRLFRQETLNDWEGIFDRMAGRLRVEIGV